MNLIPSFRTFSLFLALVHSICAADDEKGRDFGFGVPTLLVPPTSPTRHQLIWGVGVPLSLNFESIVFGLVFKAQYYLADNINKLVPTNFPGFGINGNRKRRSVFWDNNIKVENYTVAVEVIEEQRLAAEQKEKQLYEELLRGNGDSDDESISRWDFYKGLEGIAKQ